MTGGNAFGHEFVFQVGVFDYIRVCGRNVEVFKRGRKCVRKVDNLCFKTRFSPRFGHHRKRVRRNRQHEFGRITLDCIEQSAVASRNAFAFRRRLFEAQRYGSTRFARKSENRLCRAYKKTADTRIREPGRVSALVEHDYVVRAFLADGFRNDLRNATVFVSRRNNQNNGFSLHLLISLFLVRQSSTIIGMIIGNCLSR